MNLKELKEMITLKNENGLTELEVEKDNVKVKLKKQPSGVIAQEVIRHAPESSGHIALAPVAQKEFSAPTQPTVAADEFVVRSPMVGTFYASPSPEAEPFISVGKVIKEDDVLCIIEAMKLMNEIKAEMAGTVTAVMVKNGQAVEYDQPLFHVKRS